ncbi:MAG TPA: ABC transporter permease [Candidatus Acidoferrum sp.]|nr:ABC transporter permease [Candidatus Acidoferrum sp.]
MNLSWCSRRKHEFEKEMNEELRFHIEEQTAANIAAGMTPEEARRQAALQLGAVEGVKENCREERRGFWLETLWADVRYGARMLRKNPGFAAVAILTLALGIGANAAIFSVVNAVLLRPLPYKNAERIVWATERFPFNHDSAAVPSPDFIGFQSGDWAFERIEAFGGGAGANLIGAGEPERVDVTNVTTGLFGMLGVQPLIGRSFLPEEGKQAGSNVALLNETLWRTRLGADRQIIGKTISLDGTAYRVVGVIPASVRYPSADVWTPLALDSDVFSPHSPRWMLLAVIGRLKPGISVDQARSNLQVLIQRMDREYPPQAAQFRAKAHADVVPLHDVLVQNVRSLLLILLAAVGLVLMIACANVANLLLSRAAVRGREIAVRAALGANRRRLVQQMLTESLLLAASGGLVGVLAGVGGTHLLKRLVPATLPSDFTFDFRIFGFVIGVSVLALILFGLVPALVASHTDLNEVVKNGGVVRQRGAAGLRSLLVLGEISLSLMLLSGAGLLVRSFWRLTEVDLGFDPRHLLIATVQRPLTLGFDSRQHAAFFQETLDRIRALPGVQRAAVTRQYPLGPLNNATIRLGLADGTFYRPGTPILVNAISADYFAAMGIRLLKGRGFDVHGSADAPGVVILSESLARQAFKERNPLGQRISTGPGAPQLTVVGVVSNTRNSTLDQQPLPEIYLPFAQQPSFAMTFVIRTEADPGNLAGAVRQAVLSTDRNQPLSELQTMDDVLAASVAPQRFRMLLVGSLALLALALATVGIYGVVAYSVSQRTHEIGIRMALGARGPDVMKLVLRRAAALAVAGVGVGIVGALWLTRFFSSLLFDVAPTDPLTFFSVSLLLVGVALLAAYVPARRAMRLDPMTALRYE